MRRVIELVLIALLCSGAMLWARPAAAASSLHHVTAPQVMTAYVNAIRYFNPGIDQPEAEEIVAAIMRESWDQKVDPRLVVAIVATESSFDPTARSSAGARGLGQLMPSTAASDNVTDVENIDQNIHATVLTLKGNIEHYSYLDAQDCFVRAIAAYNAGTGAVDRYGGVPPYDETVNYVFKVISLWRHLTGQDSD
ncbi:MAG: lytic transglycosylase domain-containing protein [Candidatus Eremiobacteraeota bacterium]|nr:lytic transglycosylase domain-containing protein [Candidatus Eremiobacteraeota bacterium]MBV8365733.1 lytic transglycosylase domain-containing protein [Candidatus Eremiobacteraeota bacterium]